VLSKANSGWTRIRADLVPAGLLDDFPGSLVHRATVGREMLPYRPGDLCTGSIRPYCTELQGASSRPARIRAIVIYRQEVETHVRSIRSGCSPAVHDRATEVVATGSATTGNSRKVTP
jgi:hypothetical protein